jgi:putative transcriptional regulator
MAIRVHLDRVMLERGMSLTELAERVGITLANLSILKSNKARAVRFSTLDALCGALHCSPGDILKHSPSPSEEHLLLRKDDEP